MSKTADLLASQIYALLILNTRGYVVKDGEMSYLVAAPDMLATAATDVDRIASAIDAANAAAAAPTSSVLAAAEDEVSAAIANLFGAYGQDYQAVLKQAAAFQSEFTQTLTTAANAYAQAETANAALVSAAVSNAPGAVNAPIRTLLGQTAVGEPSGVGTVTSMVRVASADPLVALIMGGTGNPQPDPIYVAAINNAYIQRAPFLGAIPQGLFTPEQFWPVTPTLGNMTFGQSVTQGVSLLNAEINNQIHTLGNSVVVFGYSQSATIATNEISALLALPSASQPTASQLAFMMIGNPNNPDGGLLERFPGFYIPFLDVPFNGATPPNTPWPTYIYTAQYDGIADAPQYPLNLISDLNAVMGYFYVHGTYPTLTATQVANAVPLATSPDYTGNTHYYMFLTQNLPLVQPIRNIPYLGPPLADLIQPDLRVLVDLGYGNIGTGFDYANVPTPASLFQLVSPSTILVDLGKGLVQGPEGALVDIGLLPPSFTPDTYPYVPSLQPGLTIEIGQPSVTGLSLASGLVGRGLELIPPIFPIFP